MIEAPLKQQEQMKRFSFFESEKVQDKVDNPKLHPKKLTDISVGDIAMVGPRILFIDKNTNEILVYVKCIEGMWKPYSGTTLRMISNDTSEDAILATIGEDLEDQRQTTYIKFWKLSHMRENYQDIKPLRTLLLGQVGQVQRNITCLHFMRDLSIFAIGKKNGQLIKYDCKNFVQTEPKMDTKMLERKEIKIIQGVKRMNDIDLYFTTEESFFWFQSLSEKRRLIQKEAEIIEATVDETVLVTFIGDSKNIYEYKAGKEIRTWSIEGQKKIIKEWKRNYLINALFQKGNQKNNTQEKYRLQIMDTKNQYIAYFQTYAKIESILTNRNNIIIVGRVIFYVEGVSYNERVVYILTEKDNSFKIQTFFKKSFFNEAWRFAKNQNCQESLLAEISRLHGDLLYSKNDYAGSIKQYILTLGFVEPSYVIRRFLQVSQIDNLIQYLQKIHEKKFAKKEHTALLLNCYVKKQKIDSLSTFLTESSSNDSDLFDIETAIKVCKDLKHTEDALRLARQKSKHELYLKILIQDKRDYDTALEHIKREVEMQEKEKYLIEFGQEFMKFIPEKTIQLIKLLVRAHSISQIIRGREKQYMLTPEEKYVLEQLNFNYEELQSLSIITFKKPDQYFRLFIVNSEEDLENFLIYLIKDIPKLPHQQVVFHRLIEFYLQMMKSHPDRKEEYETKILDNLQHENKKQDNNHLLALFKMYEFDEGVVTLCKKLGMRDDLLNFFISKNRDKDILELCEIHGKEEINLWIHALKYFVKPEHKKEYYIPDILEHLSRIPNLSPLPILSILSKNKNIEYKFIKSFFLTKLRQDKEEIQDNNKTIKKNMRQAEKGRNDFKNLKTKALPFLSNNCIHCNNSLTFPSIHFMCGHSFHENCLGGDKECTKCGYQMKNTITRKEKLAEGIRDQTKLFEELEEHKATGFEIISKFLGKGLLVNPPDMQ